MRVTAIIGSYRKGGIIDKATDEILASAKAAGAKVSKIYLADKEIGFCTNCRSCTQQEGPSRGKCIITDDMGPILDLIEQSDAIVLASPMNFGTVTALMKRFIERLVCYAYWPWGMKAPRPRKRRKDKVAVVVSSSAAPAFISRLMTQIVHLLKKTATILGARTIGVLFIGLAAGAQQQDMGKRARQKAHRMGKRLASAASLRR
ncbi:MAG: flavodoxin family protein [Thermodesulfovibrionales bacterium]|jgi:multimeric flavodoxin WrbA